MPFYEPSDSRFTRHYREEVEMALSAIDCVLCREQAIYASTELTTGLRLYDALRQSGVLSAGAFKERAGGREAFTTHVWDPNIAGALEFAERVRLVDDRRTLVITPAPFSAPGWSQPEYLAFWETLLRTRIKAAWFNQNWQFSNGCTFEFAVAVDAGLPTLDHGGQSLAVEAAAGLISDAIHTLAQDGFDVSTLRVNLDRLTGTRRYGGAVTR
jgi:hypothetical protein